MSVASEDRMSSGPKEPWKALLLPVLLLTITLIALLKYGPDSALLLAAGLTCIIRKLRPKD